MFSHRKELTSDAEPSTQDGSNSSSGELHSSETRRKTTKQWKSQEVLMLKTETSTCQTSMEELNNNGILSTPKTGRVNQPPVNGTEIGASLLTKTSISFLLWVKEDTLTTFQETLLSRLRTVEQARNGTSINHQELSDLDQPTNLSISTTQVKETICNTTLPHQDGGRCSSINLVTSPISRMVRLLASRITRMLKDNQFGQYPEVDMLPKDGESPIFTRRMLERLIPRRVA
jgi:hypothetical protein